MATKLNQSQVIAQLIINISSNEKMNNSRNTSYGVLMNLPDMAAKYSFWTKAVETALDQHFGQRTNASTGL